MSKLTDLARGQECKVRIPGICCFNSETVVCAHIRMAGLTGVGTKAIDLLSAHACDTCHAAIDGRLKSAYTKEQLELFHWEGVGRTIDWLFRRGKL